MLNGESENRHFRTRRFLDQAAAVESHCDPSDTRVTQGETSVPSEKGLFRSSVGFDRHEIFFSAVTKLSRSGRNQAKPGIMRGMTLDPCSGL